MTLQEAREILTLYRPGSDDARDADFAEALALARQDAELEEWFTKHCAVQDAIRARFRQIDVPEGLQQQIISERKPVATVVWWRQPVFLAAAAGVAVLMGFAVFWLRPTPPDDERLNLATFRSRMGGQALRNYPMTLETDDLGQIRSHLAERQSPADFVLPAPLEQTALAGCGVLRWRDKSVSMVCFRTGKPLGPGEKSDLFLFVVDRSSLPDAPGGSSPEFAQVGKLVTATWSLGDKTYVLASPDGEIGIQKYL